MTERNNIPDPGRNDGAPSTSRKLTVTLWVLQGLLATLSLFAGGVKLVLPLDALKGPVEFPGLFLSFIGVAEVLGALGPILEEMAVDTRQVYVHIDHDILDPEQARGSSYAVAGG
jgi:hypothetical protein